MINNKVLMKILALVTFVGMIVVNALANILPINGITTGGVSDSYPNLFAPAGITFSIWGLIYLLLLIYVVYQFFQKSPKKEALLRELNIYFIISSIVNSVWIFAWHYKMIGLTVVLMLVILYCLIMISRITSEKAFSLKDKLYIKIPFGVYFGWITIATIANITTFLVSIGWENFIFRDDVWMIIVLIVGLGIASFTALKQNNLAYGLVPVWAYLGIYLKHTSSLNFNNMYPNIVTTTIICIFIFIILNLYLINRKRYP